MIHLHQYPPTWGLPSASPYCIKVETYLRICQLPFAIVEENNPRKGPKGKMPFIEDNGKTIADSTFIIEYLKATYGDALDKDLSPEQRAIALAFQRLMEENLYWPLLYSRWIDERGWQVVKPTILSLLPPLLAPLILHKIRKDLARQCYAQGIGRHSRDEIYAIGRRDLDAVANYLGDKRYFFGVRPTTIDATLYGFMATILWTPVAGPLQEHARSLANLSRFCEHIRDTYYGEVE